MIIIVVEKGLIAISCDDESRGHGAYLWVS